MQVVAVVVCMCTRDCVSSSFGGTNGGLHCCKDGCFALAGCVVSTAYIFSTALPTALFNKLISYLV